MTPNRCRRSTGLMSEVNGRALVPAFSSVLLMCYLPSSRWNVSFSHGRSLLRSWPSANSTGTIETDPTVSYHMVSAIDIGVTHDRPVNISNRSVIVEGTAFPAASIVSDTAVAEAVIYAAIKPNIRSPITGMPSVKSSGVSPITGRPEKANFGRVSPVSRHPVVSIVAIGPITRYPYFAVGRARGLIIYRQ
jgi:hypothetical protein